MGPEYSARLVIRREGDSFQARWVESEGQDSDSFMLRLPLSSKDAADLRWYLEEYPGFVGAGTRARAAGIEARLDGWGHALFDAAFGTPEGTHVYRNLREAVDARRRVLLTFGTSEADVLVQPWEMMRDREGPLAFRGVSIRRDFAHHLDRFTDDTAEEGRNRSLRASLAFSVSRLSEAARAVLPWLAWFQGGAFETSIRNFTGLEADPWAAVRQELVATALVRVEELEMFNTPFLRFHPTLPYAARAEDVPDTNSAEEFFLGVYLAVSREVNSALKGKTAAAGMELMAREEANFRSAIDRAFRRGERQQGWALADTLQSYLQRAARPRERDALATWVRAQMPDAAGLDAATCAATRQHAWSLFGQGRAGEAVETLRELIRRLETEGLADGADAAFEIGTSYVQMGQILVNARRPDLALEPCRKAIEHLERIPGEAAQGNLSAALGDLANALRSQGRLPEALKAAEQALAIALELGRDRNAAAGHGRCAEILSRQGRYGEAEARYQEAQRLAEQVGDLELQGTFLQHRGSLNREQGQKATTAQNLGILFQTRAGQTEDPEAREALLRKAVASVEESLATWLKREDRVAAASSDSQLGVLHQMLGDLDRAEEHLLKSLEVYESLNLPEVWKVYGNLADVAEARGDAEAAAVWQAKCDAKLAELKRLRGWWEASGEGGAGDSGSGPGGVCSADLGGRGGGGRCRGLGPTRGSARAVARGGGVSARCGRGRCASGAGGASRTVAGDFWVVAGGGSLKRRRAAVACNPAPEGAAACSQGRQPLEPEQIYRSPGGA